MSLNWSQDFKENAIYRIDENVRMVEIALSKTTTKEVWEKEIDAVNTIANLILHLCGNMTQYVLSGLTGKEDLRNRDLEFDQVNGHTKEELLEKLMAVVDQVKAVINTATEEQLLTKYTVQGFDLSGTGLILHAVEHFSYHTGQIALLVKLETNEPLGFYDGLDLNVKNEME